MFRQRYWRPCVRLCVSSSRTPDESMLCPHESFLPVWIWTFSLSEISCWHQNCYLCFLHQVMCREPGVFILFCMKVHTNVLFSELKIRFLFSFFTFANRLLLQYILRYWDFMFSLFLNRFNKQNHWCTNMSLNFICYHFNWAESSKDNKYYF